ncbi:Hypothetical protein A7982_06380 [Minicystis rosea]|nr:Hypothetical protein A7982_06380 [Minicystis rosea]
MNQIDDIDRAIDYCETLDEGFRARIRGATTEVIDGVADGLGRPLDAGHRRFLERLGESAGGLDFGTLDPSAAVLVRSLRMTYGDPPPGFELFAVGRDEPFEDLYLVERNGTRVLELLNSRKGTTYGSLADDAGTILAGSIAELMCVRALRRHVADVLPFRAVLGQTEDGGAGLDVLDTVLARLGLLPLWFSSALTRVATAPGLVVIGRQPPGGALVVRLASADGEVFAAVETALADALGMRRSE